MEGALCARGITQRFGDRLVLDGVDLEVPAGRVIGLLGPNGAGKTTLMRILFGVLTPDEGSVEWRGRPATEEDRRSWGYMPQERGLYRDMRVLDQVSWIGRLHGLEHTTAEARAQDLLDRLGLGDRSGDKIMNLSGGMAQRVQLAAAMVHEPDLLVLDEPFAGLDPLAVEFLSAVVRDHVAAGRHLLFSSHQLDLVEDLCETITLINRGRVVLQGDLQALKAASPERMLRVDVPVDRAWIAGGDGRGEAGASVVSSDASGTRLRLLPGADAAAVLDRVRRHADVRDFGVETPSLSELFVQAAGRSTEEIEAESAGGPTADGGSGGERPSLLARLTGGRAG